VQTGFSLHRLADPRVAEAERIIRSCVHCGFCTATCPTYVTLGNELDSPRGRIYLIKEMLENDRPADRDTVTHLDRCLSCLSCMTTCPSGVDYMHLVDHARNHVAATYRRPLPERLIRAALAAVLPHPRRFRLALSLARIGRPFRKLFASSQALKPLAAMLALVPDRLPRAAARPAEFSGARRGRVAILSGCAQQVLDPAINAAATALLGRLGIEVARPAGEGCCGALVHHMGREAEALASARRNVDAWMREIEGDGLDAILITASGCGTVVKDYGHMLRLDPAYAEKAARVSALALDITEYLARLELPEPARRPGLRVAYHSACSLQHGQKVTRAPAELLRRAGFEVAEPAESHLCCGSAGTYNLLQPDLAATLGRRKAANLERLGADVVASGNIGCITQIGKLARLPVVHTVQLLDWAWGGERPAGIGG
jgi:glycolate oxidase iron-sulfur subunit